LARYAIILIVLTEGTPFSGAHASLFASTDVAAGRCWRRPTADVERAGNLGVSTVVEKEGPNNTAHRRPGDARPEPD
jgi:hypothetical protein